MVWMVIEVQAHRSFQEKQREEKDRKEQEMEVRSMETDPICGMDIQEKGARHLIHLEHETIYFCSDRCKEKFAQDSGMKTVVKKKGVFARFLEKLAKNNEETFGGSPPKCH